MRWKRTLLIVTQCKTMTFSGHGYLRGSFVSHESTMAFCDRNERGGGMVSHFKSHHPFQCMKSIICLILRRRYSLSFASALTGLCPKMVLPTLTSPLPSLMAPSKSSLIPMLSSNLPSPSPSSLATRSRCSLSLTKSSFSLSAVVALLRAMAPMVMRPRRCRPGHDSRISRQRATVSEPGAQPDLDSSPEVLTCTWTESLVREGEAASKSARVVLRRRAFLEESTLDTQKRLGILARDLQWPIPSVRL